MDRRKLLIAREIKDLEKLLENPLPYKLYKSVYSIESSENAYNGLLTL